MQQRHRECYENKAEENSRKPYVTSLASKTSPVRARWFTTTVQQRESKATGTRLLPRRCTAPHGHETYRE